MHCSYILTEIIARSKEISSFWLCQNKDTNTETYQIIMLQKKQYNLTTANPSKTVCKKSNAQI